VSFASVSFEVEFWNEAWGGKWCEGAKISLKQRKNGGKAILEWRDDQVAALRIDSALTIEHSEPFARDFNLVISSAGISVRVALFSEEDGATCLKTLQDAGAKVITLAKLAPPITPTTRTLPSHHRPSVLLGPISEIEPLNSVQSEEEDRKQRRTSSDFVTIVKMRLDGGRRKVLRRKSTGGESDLVGRMGSPSTSINPMPTSPSISMKDNSMWYFNPASDSKESDSSRGLSTAESAKMKNHKHQSNQSLASDEISRSSNSSGMSESETSTEEEEGEVEDATAVEEAEDEKDDDDRPDGLIRDLASRLKFGKSEEVTEEGMEETLGYVPNRKTNEKLEKFKFLLVNLEDDAEVLDPGDFGVSGDYVGCHFNDYPDEDSGNATSPSLKSRSRRSNSRNKEWIRMSFEELNLESVSTEHSSRKRNREGLDVSPTLTTAKSMDNMNSPVIMRSVKIVGGHLDLGEDIEGTIV